MWAQAFILCFLCLGITYPPSCGLAVIIVLLMCSNSRSKVTYSCVCSSKLGAKQPRLILYAWGRPVKVWTTHSYILFGLTHARKEGFCMSDCLRMLHAHKINSLEPQCCLRTFFALSYHAGGRVIVSQKTQVRVEKVVGLWGVCDCCFHLAVEPIVSLCLRWIRCRLKR